MFRHKKTINKDTINNQFEDFFRRIKLRAYLKNKKNKNLSSEEDRFQKSTNKNWIPTNIHHSIETFIEATPNEIQNKTEKNTTIKIVEPNNQTAESNSRTAI